MGLPFTVVTGTVFITDSDGEIAEVVTRSDSSKALATQSEIVGQDSYNVLRNVQTVQRTDGLYALATQSLVTVESTFGYDQNPDTWFRILTTGAAGDTLSIYIAGTNNDSTSPDVDAPPFSKMFTVLASEVGDEIKFRDRIVQELNSDPAFIKNGINFRAQRVTDRPIVHITSNRFSLSGEFWERPNLGDFQVTTTGTCNVYVGYDNVISRSKPVSISRDYDSPHRLGLFGITGQVQVTAKDLDDLFIQNATLNGDGVTTDLRVNGATTNQTFLINPSPDNTIFIEELRFFGSGNGIQFGKFLSQNNALTNGIYIEIKSNDTITVLPVIKTTDDFKNRFAFGGGGASGFQLDIASGRDDFIAVFTFNNPFVLTTIGSYTVNDYIKVVIRDNLSSGLQQLEFMVKGFEKAP